LSALSSFLYDVIDNITNGTQKTSTLEYDVYIELCTKIGDELESDLKRWLDALLRSV
jgi:hypothetical protein